MKIIFIIIMEKRKKIIIISLFYKSFNPRDAIIIHILKENRMNDSLIDRKLKKTIAFLKRERERTK